MELLYGRDNMKCNAPRTERPMVSIHGVREFARFGTRRCVADITIWVECKSVDVRKQISQLGGFALEEGILTSRDISPHCDEYRNS
jgi:hypothetical protein